MNLYVASSWRNRFQQDLVAKLRAKGHEVYDFKNPKGAGENTGFGWQQIDPNWRTWTPEQYRLALTHATAQKGFESDERGMVRANACVLCMPSGRSAHVEWGWMVGRGKIGYVLLNEEGFEPDLMYLLTPLTHICTSEEELFARIAEDDESLRTKSLPQPLRPEGEPISLRWKSSDPPLRPTPKDKVEFFNKIADEIVLPGGGTCDLPPPGPPLLVYVQPTGKAGVVRIVSVATGAVFADEAAEPIVPEFMAGKGYVSIEPTLRERLKAVTLKNVPENAEVYIHAAKWAELNQLHSDDEAWFKSIQAMLP